MVKLNPLVEVPNKFPPFAASHQEIVKPEDVAKRWVESPQFKEDGKADESVGIGNAAKATDTEVLDDEPHEAQHCA